MTAMPMNNLNFILIGITAPNLFDDNTIHLSLYNGSNKPQREFDIKMSDVEIHEGVPTAIVAAITDGK